jgi:type II secretory pathway pseudopilin PulG
MAANLPHGSHRRAATLRTKGFAYIGLLVAIVVIGAALAAVGEVWSIQGRREREVELLYRGDAIRRAIGHYVRLNPGGAGHYPQELQDLVQDERWPQVQRYLRRIYEDPITGAADWTLIRAADGGIMGVASSSTAAPIKRQGFENFAIEDSLFADMSCYCDWQFIYQPRGPRYVMPPTTAPPETPPTKPPAVPPSRPPTITMPH